MASSSASSSNNAAAAAMFNNICSTNARSELVNLAKVFEAAKLYCDMHEVCLGLVLIDSWLSSEERALLVVSFENVLKGEREALDKLQKNRAKLQSLYEWAASHTTLSAADDLGPATGSLPTVAQGGVPPDSLSGFASRSTSRPTSAKAGGRPAFVPSPPPPAPSSLSPGVSVDLGATGMQLNDILASQERGTPQHSVQAHLSWEVCDFAVKTFRLGSNDRPFRNASYVAMRAARSTSALQRTSMTPTAPVNADVVAAANLMSLGPNPLQRGGSFGSSSAHSLQLAMRRHDSLNQFEATSDGQRTPQSHHHHHNAALGSAASPIARGASLSQLGSTLATVASSAVDDALGGADTMNAKTTSPAVSLEVCDDAFELVRRWHDADPLMCVGELLTALRFIDPLIAASRRQLTLLCYRAITLTVDLLLPACAARGREASLFYRRWMVDVYRALLELELLEDFNGLLQKGSRLILADRTQMAQPTASALPLPLGSLGRGSPTRRSFSSLDGAVMPLQRLSSAPNLRPSPLQQAQYATLLASVGAANLSMTTASGYSPKTPKQQQQRGSQSPQNIERTAPRPDGEAEEWPPEDDAAEERQLASEVIDELDDGGPEGDDMLNNDSVSSPFRLQRHMSMVVGGSVGSGSVSSNHRSVTLAAAVAAAASASAAVAPASVGKDALANVSFATSAATADGDGDESQQVQEVSEPNSPSLAQIQLASSAPLQASQPPRSPAPTVIDPASIVAAARTRVLGMLLRSMDRRVLPTEGAPSQGQAFSLETSPDQQQQQQQLPSAGSRGRLASSVASTGSRQQQFAQLFAHGQAHHHFFNYPVVTAWRDVAQLHAELCNEARINLNPHNPVVATIVNNYIDFLAAVSPSSSAAGAPLAQSTVANGSVRGRGQAAASGSATPTAVASSRNTGTAKGKAPAGAPAQPSAVKPSSTTPLPGGARGGTSGKGRKRSVVDPVDTASQPSTPSATPSPMPRSLEPDETGPATTILDGDTTSTTLALTEESVYERLQLALAIAESYLADVEAEHITQPMMLSTSAAWLAPPSVPAAAAAAASAPTTSPQGGSAPTRMSAFSVTAAGRRTTIGGPSPSASPLNETGTDPSSLTSSFTSPGVSPSAAASAAPNITSPSSMISSPSGGSMNLNVPLVIPSWHTKDEKDRLYFVLRFIKSAQLALKKRLERLTTTVES